MSHPRLRRTVGISRLRRTGSSSRLRRAGSLLAVGAVAGTLLVACGGEDRSDIDYLVDARVSSYNANTVDGHADGTVMALTRVLPGFSIVGPQGQIISDHDIGTVTPQPGEELTLRYEFAKGAVYSDDTPMTCDDIVLAATAMSGDTPGFAAATNAGYRDIARVDCAAGERAATVVFKRGRTYDRWNELFGAGTLLPAHVVARKAGVPNVVDPIRRGDKAAVAKIAEAWNTGFTLTPGAAVDEKVLLSAGPYKIESYSVDGGLELVANDKWWGAAPDAATITVWPRGTDGKAALDGSRATVIDTADLALGDRLRGATTSTAAPADRTVLREPPPLSVTQLVFAPKGVAADPLVRKALAACMPRDTLARRLGTNGVVWNLRTASPADPLGPSLNVQYGRRYPRSDVPRARELLGQRQIDGGTRAKPAVRIGYPAPDPQSAQAVKMIAEACAPAGITVEDVASPEFSVTALGDAADAVLISDGSFAASSTASGFPEAFALYVTDPLNLSGFRNKQVSEAITELANTTSDSARLPLLRTIETAAWDQLPTIPLYGTARARESTSVARVVPGMGVSGTGWNMDRWGVS